MLINFWHSVLDMPKYDEKWHYQDIQEELNELKEAKGFFKILSEKSDVVYTYTRARWSGHNNILIPLNTIDFILGLFYMFPKYTLRWLFFRIVARRIGVTTKVTEVRNPRKIKKLRAIALKYGIDEQIFKKECQSVLKWWILFP